MRLNNDDCGEIRSYFFWRLSRHCICEGRPQVDETLENDKQASLLLSIRGRHDEAQVQNLFFTQVDASADS
jgi:hypothetical protein